MCGIGIVAAGLQVAGGVMQARSQYQAGMASAAYNDYLSKQAEQEAIATERVGKAQSAAIQETAAFRSKGLARSQAKESSSQRAALAAAGVQGVSAENIVGDTSNVQAMDRATLRYNADLDSWQTMTDSTYRAYAARNQASQYKAAAGFERSAAKRNAFTTLLGTATSVLSPFAAKSNFAIPGFGGYGFNTPLGTRNMGTYSKLR